MGLRGQVQSQGPQVGWLEMRDLHSTDRDGSAATALKYRPHPLGQASDFGKSVSSGLPPWPNRS